MDQKVNIAVKLPPEQDLLNTVIRDRLRGRPVRVLEVGGGDKSHIEYDMLDARDITVVDIEEDQLHRNTYATHKIHGDIERVALDGTYNLIIAYNVFEHLERPDRALLNILPALEPEGVLVIGSPLEQSFAGLITRFTPHSVHVWYRRNLMGARQAGTLGGGPFPTVFHPLVRPDRLIPHLVQTGLRPVYVAFYEAGRYWRLRKRRPLVGGVLLMLTAAINVFFAGRRDVRQGDYHLVFQKP